MLDIPGIDIQEGARQFGAEHMRAQAEADQFLKEHLYMTLDELRAALPETRDVEFLDIAAQVLYASYRLLLQARADMQREQVARGVATQMEWGSEIPTTGGFPGHLRQIAYVYDQVESVRRRLMADHTSGSVT